MASSYNPDRSVLVSDILSHVGLTHAGKMHPHEAVSFTGKAWVSHPLDDENDEMWDILDPSLKDIDLKGSIGLSWEFEEEPYPKGKGREGKPDVKQVKVCYRAENITDEELSLDVIKVNCTRLSFYRTLKDNCIEYCSRCALKGDYRNYEVK